MSSISLSCSRKRLHSSNFRDNRDSEDDSPPVKLKRKVAGAGANIPVALSAQLKKILVWCSNLPVKGFFTMALKTGANFHEEIILDDDASNEEDEGRQKAYIKRLEQVQQQLLSRQRQRRELELIEPRQQRYPTRGSDIIFQHDSRSDRPHKSNGSRSVSWRPICNGSNADNLRLYKDSATAPVSSPSTDVEILLDSGSKEPTEPDDIQIISESVSVKPKLTSSQRPSKTVSTRSSVSAHNRSHSSKCYTAHEVVRLQEKAQYQLLLEKYISGNQYHNAFKKKSLDDDDLASLEFSGTGFNNVLYQPVGGFIQKYLKQAPENSVKPQVKPIEITIDDEPDVALLPKCKPNYGTRAKCFTEGWIAQLRSNVYRQTEERLRITEKHEKMLESLKKKRQLEKLNQDINSEVGDPELPALTCAMEEVIDQALHGDPEECICKVKGANVHRKDLETLDGLSWLNDLIINSYFDLIVERSKYEGFPSVYAYNTFFYSSLKCRGYSAVKRWTRKTDIFSYDLNFIPLHLGVHWALGVIDHRSKKVCYYDSMGDSEDKCLEMLHEYIGLEHKDKKGTDLDMPYTVEVMKDIPQQMNGSDCGMFTLKYAEYISRCAEITFSQKDMAYFRRKMVYELLSGKII